MTLCLAHWSIVQTEQVSVLLLGGYSTTRLTLRVHMISDTSAWRSQRNGLCQGSVFTAVLFTNDVPAMKAQKMIYAHDICLTTQSQYFTSQTKSWAMRKTARPSGFGFPITELKHP